MKPEGFSTFIHEYTFTKAFFVGILYSCIYTETDHHSYFIMRKKCQNTETILYRLLRIELIQPAKMLTFSKKIVYNQKQSKTSDVTGYPMWRFFMQQIIILIISVSDKKYIYEELLWVLK